MKITVLVFLKPSEAAIITIFVKKLKHFPHKHIGNHFLARRWVYDSCLIKNVEFIYFYLRLIFNLSRPT